MNGDKYNISVQTCDVDHGAIEVQFKFDGNEPSDIEIFFDGNGKEILINLSIKDRTWLLTARSPNNREYIPGFNWYLRNNYYFYHENNGCLYLDANNKIIRSNRPSLARFIEDNFPSIRSQPYKGILQHYQPENVIRMRYDMKIFT